MAHLRDLIGFQRSQGLRLPVWLDRVVSLGIVSGDPDLVRRQKVANLVSYAAAINAFFTLGQYSWMPVWLPELFPTRSRGTGIAFVFNAPRFIAFLGPLFAGTLIVQFGGYGKAAMIFACIYFLGLVAAPFLPETKGKPLPEDV